MNPSNDISQFIFQMANISQELKDFNQDITSHPSTHTLPDLESIKQHLNHPDWLLSVTHHIQGSAFDHPIELDFLTTFHLDSQSLFHSRSFIDQKILENTTTTVKKIVGEDADNLAQIVTDSLIPRSIGLVESIKPINPANISLIDLDQVKIKSGIIEMELINHQIHFNYAHLIHHFSSILNFPLHLSQQEFSSHFVTPDTQLESKNPFSCQFNWEDTALNHSVNLNLSCEFLPL